MISIIVSLMTSSRHRNKWMSPCNLSLTCLKAFSILLIPMNGQGSSSEIRPEWNAGEISFELLSKDFKKQSILNGSERNYPKTAKSCNILIAEPSRKLSNEVVFLIVRFML
jgi:hypothetical protein